MHSREPDLPAARSGVLLRLDPAVHDAPTRWAHDEPRSSTARIEFLLHRPTRDGCRATRAARKQPSEQD